MRLRVGSESELPWLQREVRDFAEQAGLAPSEAYAVALAATEAATNMLKYAASGELLLKAGGGPPAWVEFTAVDHGAGIGDVTLAMRDGVSEGVHLSETLRPGERRGLGAGLGAIQRLMSEVEVGRAPDGGTLLRARKQAR
jgi:serine/threonine-protein kinase RsbT